MCLQVYLAVPSNCPYHPDGSKRRLTAEETVSSSVILYASSDEGTTFSEVRSMRPHFLGLQKGPQESCLRDSLSAGVHPCG